MHMHRIRRGLAASAVAASIALGLVLLVSATGGNAGAGPDHFGRTAATPATSTPGSPAAGQPATPQPDFVPGPETTGNGDQMMADLEGAAATECLERLGLLGQALDTLPRCW
jgi:hypothetical protein